MPSAGSGSATPGRCRTVSRATGCRTSPPAWPGRATCSAPGTAAPRHPSTSWPPTTASRWPTSPPTTASTTTPTARATATAVTATAPGTTVSRGPPPTTRCWRRVGARSGPCSAPCSSRPGSRCSPPVTSWAAPSTATTTPTARTTRSPGSTGRSSPGRRTSSRRRDTSRGSAERCPSCGSASGRSGPRCTTTAPSTWSGTPPTVAPWRTAGRVPGNASSRCSSPEHGSACTPPCSSSTAPATTSR